MTTRLISNLNYSAKATYDNFLWPSAVAVCGYNIWVALYSSNLVNVYDKKCLTLKYTFTVTSPTGIAICSKKSALVTTQEGVIYSLTLEKCKVTKTVNPVTSGIASSPTPLNAIVKCGDIVAVASSEGFAVHIYRYDGTNAVHLKMIDDTALKSFGFGPVSLTLFECKLYILYTDWTHNVGNGYVNVVNIKKKCKSFSVERLICQENLCDPTSMSITETKIYITNSLTGLISVFERECGTYLHNLSNGKGGNIVIGANTGSCVHEDRLYVISSLDTRKIGNLISVHAE